jgi:hypothetical protein
MQRSFGRYALATQMRVDGTGALPIRFRRITINANYAAS